jgi:hypothetical protein
MNWAVGGRKKVTHSLIGHLGFKPAINGFLVLQLAFQPLDLLKVLFSLLVLVGHLWGDVTFC